MKFKSLYFLSALFVSACCLTSCEEGTEGNTDDLETIYWNKSAAFKLQLKGKVKKLVTVDSAETYMFNQSGNFLSETYAYEVTEFEYTDGGSFFRSITSWGEGGYADTTTITYVTSGKYLPINQYNFTEDGLYRNIASVIRGNGTTRYVQRGDSMLMITSQEGHMPYVSRVQEYADTASLTFDGGLFPLTLRNRDMVCNMTYASDGRFLTVEEIRNYYEIMSDKTTYKSDSQYILPISIVRKRNGVVNTTETFTYDEETEVLLSHDDGYYTHQYDTYFYDSTGNWTSRKHTTIRNSDTNQTPLSEETETRDIEYYD